MSEDPLAGLKTRRKGGGARTSTGAPAPPSAPAGPLAQTMQRAMPYLFDPAEMPAVVESNGLVPDADLEKFYVVATEDAHRSTVPDGCVTPVTVQLWLAGQHVRRDAYAAYRKEHEANGTQEGATP